MTCEKRNRIIDAERTPAEDWKHAPAAYSRRCRIIRRAKRRSRIICAQRLLVVGVPVLVAALLVAVR